MGLTFTISSNIACSKMVFKSSSIPVKCSALMLEGMPLCVNICSPSGTSSGLTTFFVGAIAATASLRHNPVSKAERYDHVTGQLELHKKILTESESTS